MASADRVSQADHIPAPRIGRVEMPIASAPNPEDTRIIYLAQSKLTRNGQVGPLLSVEEAREVLARDEKQAKEGA